MSSNAEEIIKEARALPVEERAELLEVLLATFQSPPDPHLDELWVAEAEDRLDAYERGELAAIPADEVFRKVRQRRQK